MRRVPALLAILAAVTSCGLEPAPSTPPDPPWPPLPAQRVPADMRPYLNPDRDLFGVSIGRLPGQADLDGFAGKVGRRPSLFMYFMGWGEEFQAEPVAELFGRGTLPLVAMETPRTPPAEIASGAWDGYARGLARRMRDAGHPIAFSYGHEMNGWWYPWGVCNPREPGAAACRKPYRKNRAKDYVAAYRRLFRIFQDEGAVNVLWVWAPNATDHVPGTRPIESFYPGDEMVDWVGLINYISVPGKGFDYAFGGTMRSLRRFSHRPVLLAETGVSNGRGKDVSITSLVERVADDHKIVGLVWFDLDKEHDWRVDSSPRALTAFRRAIADPRFDFTP